MTRSHIVTVDKLTASEYLIMEVLAARTRLGERVWTFPRSFKRALKHLEQQQLVNWKDGIAEATCLAWLTDGGIIAWLSKTYKSPTDKLNGIQSLVTQVRDGRIAYYDRYGDSAVELLARDITAILE